MVIQTMKRQWERQREGKSCTRRLVFVVDTSDGEKRKWVTHTHSPCDSANVQREHWEWRSSQELESNSKSRHSTSLLELLSANGAIKFAFCWLTAHTERKWTMNSLTRRSRLYFVLCTFYSLLLPFSLSYSSLLATCSLAGKVAVAITISSQINSRSTWPETE